MQIGSKIYYKHINGFTSWLQRQVLGTKFSHVSIYYGQDNYGYPLEFEASLEVEVSSYKPDKAHQDTYEWIDVPEEVLKDALMKVKAFEFTSYGVGSWLTIFIKRIFLLFGFENAISWRIFWDHLVVCSTVVWYYNKYVADEMSVRYTPKREYFQRYLYELERYNPATFTPPEDFQLCQKHKQLFRIKQ